MKNLNIEFFDEYKSLDNLCRDIYGNNDNTTPGVTLYIKDMESKEKPGLKNVYDWKSDYYRLIEVRRIRNKLAHSSVPLSVNQCSPEDIEFIKSFKKRILCRTDPISMLKMRTVERRTFRQSQHNHKHSSGDDTQNKLLTAWVAMSLSLLIIIICVIYFIK